MLIERNIDESKIPEVARGRKRHELSSVLDAFLASSDKNIAMSFDTLEEAKNKTANAATWKRRNGASVVFTRKDLVLYAIKKE